MRVKVLVTVKEAVIIKFSELNGLNLRSILP